jgi:uncharacterized protein
MFSWRRRALVAGAFAGACLGFYACVFSSSNLSDETTASNFDVRPLLANVGSNVVLATLTEFAASAAALEQACDAYATSGADDDRDAARQAWRDAMRIWQRAEVMQVGPAGVMGVAPAGQDLRDQIYSWPLVNRCRVDTEVVEGHYSSEIAFAIELVNVRGLDAMEYLLFEDASGNACAPQNDINQSGAWEAIVDELPVRRAEYAATLASLLVARANELVAAWTSSGGFLQELDSAGQGGVVFASPTAAVNAVSDALFYLDKQTKDVKLAVPAGLSDCAAATCPTALELGLSGTSKEAIVSNVEGFRALFTGGDGVGFDDWLEAEGRGALAADVVTALDAALAAAEAIEAPTLTAALADPADLDRVVALYQRIKVVTDLLKADVTGALNLELPGAVEGDND